MRTKHDTALMYMCDLIEFIGRRVNRRRSEVVEQLGSRAIERIYHYADALCADSIDRVADEYVAIAGIEPGDNDNVGTCHYEGTRPLGDQAGIRASHPRRGRRPADRYPP